MQPLRLLSQLRDTYRSYVDSFQFYKNPAIGAWVERSRETGRLLWREPFITIAKPFALGRSLKEFVDEGLLDPMVLRVFRKEIGDPASEPVDLYWHQSEAIAKQLNSRNVAVATGTGSGKSFAFFIPVVSAVARAKHAGRSGVKALLIYPMNALANSQYEDLAQRLAGTGLTVCNYTSDLKDDREAALRDFQLLTGRPEPYDSEVIDRITLRGTDPDLGANGIPDILITNYKMLEYALVRFRDQLIFPFPESTDSALMYLVLDEVHIYTGRQGADMACLVRRFKERTGTAGSLRCVATSATIESGDLRSATEATAVFAQDLFGEPFDAADVVTASYGEAMTADPAEPSTILFPDVIDEATVERAARSDSDAEVTAILGPALLGVRASEVTGQLVATHRGLGWIERHLWDGVEPLDQLVNEYRSALRPDASLEEARREVEAALLLGVAAKLPSERGPVGVVTPKIHSFFSQGSPVVKCVRPTRLHLSDTGSSSCVSCADEEELDVPAFPLVFCAPCGQEFHVAEEVDGTLVSREFRGLAEDGEPVYVMPTTWDVDDVRLPDQPYATRKSPPVPLVRTICGQCGAIGSECGHTNDRFQATIIPEPMLFCPSCGVTYDRRTSEWNKFFLVGSVGRATATDVLASRIIAGAATPEERKVIAFMDNRQDSSFQAAHLNALSRRTHLRRAIWAATTNGAQSLATTASATFKALDDAEALPTLAADPRSVPPAGCTRRVIDATCSSVWSSNSLAAPRRTSPLLKVVDCCKFCIRT